LHHQIFVNLACRDLPRAKTFFEALGYSFDPNFTNEHGACMVLGPQLHAMLLTQPFFQTFTRKAVVDSQAATEVMVCLSCSSRADVDTLVAKAVAAGGHAPRPAQDHGFMYQHSFEDLDGHIWELVHMAEPPTVAVQP
jgi:uncharacterized protein